MKDLKVLATILMAGVLFCFAACKTETDSTVVVEKVEITSTVKEVVEGSTISLTAKVSPENATNKTITWSSSDEKVATVDKNGVVTGVKAGSATITAKAGEKTVTVDITVIKLVAGVKITSTESEVAEGGSITLTAEVNPSDATDPKITWSSSDEEVATVDASTGVVTGLKVGKATITATAGEKSATVEIKVIIPVSGVKITSTENEIALNSSIAFKAEVTPSDATYPTVTWSSSDTTVATVDASTGVVTGLKVGKATITATAGEKSATVEITVKIPVTKVSLSVSANSFNAGERITLMPTIEPTDATKQNVTYTITEGKDYAIVLGDKLKGKTAGTVKVKATADGVSSEEVEVTVKSWSNDLIKVKGATITGADYQNNYTGVFPAGRTVILSDFLMSKYEVTQAEYKEVMQNQTVTINEIAYTLNAEPSDWTAVLSWGALDIESLGEVQKNRPVENVTWYDAVYYCNARSKKEIQLFPCQTTIEFTVVVHGAMTLT